MELVHICDGRHGVPGHLRVLCLEVNLSGLNVGGALTADGAPEEIG